MRSGHRRGPARAIGLHWVLFAVALALSFALIGVSAWTSSAHPQDGIAAERPGTAATDRLIIDQSDSRATRQALDIVETYGLRAVFVIDGTRAAGDPALIRSIADHGQDIVIGLPRKPHWWTAVDVRAVRLAVASTTGRIFPTLMATRPTTFYVGSTEESAARELSRIRVTARLMSVPSSIDTVSMPADLMARMGGSAIVLLGRVGHDYVDVVGVLMLIIGLLSLARILILVAAVRPSRRRRGDSLPEYTGGLVSVLVPAYNEAVCIEATVRSALATTCAVRVIVIDDGSTDGTADIIEDLDLPGVTVLRQPNRGKSAALNHGLRSVDTEFVVMVDGDTVLEPGTVAALVRHFVDPSVAAVSGNVKVGNRVGVLGTFQHIEYVIGFNFDRKVYDVLGAHATVPGAVGAFRMTAMTEMGGMPLDTLAEDTDLPMALQRAGWTVAYEAAAVAWTEVPLTVRQLWRQRFRWSFGILQSVWKHRGALADGHGNRRLGRYVLPYLVMFQYLLPLTGPFVGAAVLYGLFSGDWSSAALLWAAAWIAQVIPAVVAFRLDGEPLRPLLVLPFQQAFYQWLTSLLVFHTVIAALGGIELPWHKLDRTGLSADHLGTPHAGDAVGQSSPWPVTRSTSTDDTSVSPISARCSIRRPVPASSR